jgi:molybdopterin synthase catalytic subunit
VTVRAALVEHPLNIASLTDEVSSPACGATSVFLGTVRNLNEGRAVTGIEYTSYSAMAVAELGRIVKEAAERFSTERIVVEHRIGALTLGEVSVAIAVAHERRAPAKDASRYIIEQIKMRVPIWKREHYADGTREWVDPTRLPEAVEHTP